MRYVAVDDGKVGKLVNTDSREEKKYLVELKNGDKARYAEVTTITLAEYESYQSVATTKPKRGAKK